MDIVTTVNGKTGDVVIGADEIMSTATGQHTIEEVIESAYVATATAIPGVEGEYLLTITKRS